MAAGDIDVVINSETKAFRQGVEAGIIKPLEDAEKALDDLGKSKGPDQLTRELQSAQKSSEQLDKQIDETARNIETEFRDAYRKAGQASDTFKRDASGNVQGFKDEAVQNLSEVASSFNGDLSDMAAGVQGLTGGLASSLTPGIGIPVAIIGAIAASFAASWAQAAEDSEKRVSDMYADFIESGQTFVSESFIGDAIKAIQEDTGKWADANKRVAETGLDIGEILRAMAGDQQAIADAHAIYVAQRDEEIDKIKRSGASLEDQATAIDAVNAKFGESVEWISQIQRDTDTAADKAGAYRDAMGGAADNSARTRDELAKIAEKFASIPKSVQLGITVNSAEFDRQFNILAAKANKGIRVVLRPDQGRAWE